MVIVERGGRGPASRTLKAMFEDRKSIFVDLLRWDVPVVDGRFELDQFDNPDATYVIVGGDDGDHLGSARLLPTDRPHILDSLFGQLCAAPPPTGEDVFEITRFCLSRRHNAAQRRVTRNRLVTALTCHALDRGIRTYTGVAEIGWLQQILAFGWNCRPLGLPRSLPCGTLGALAIEIGAETPGLLAGNGIWDMGTPTVPFPQAA
ncbi:MAG: acyl-homoserine-lactone synthase [Bacillota bacterium]